MRPSTFALLALLLPACSGHLEGKIRDMAADDFGCDGQSISVKQRPPYNSSTRYYNAEGCGKIAIYNGSCPLFMCRAHAQTSPHDANEQLPEPLVRPSEDARSAEPEPVNDGSEAARDGQSERTDDAYAERPAPRPTSSRPPPRSVEPAAKQPARPAGPVILSVSFRNTCSKTVRTFMGTKPKYGSGISGSIGANTVTTMQKKPGEMIWIIDEKENGIASVTLKEGVRSVEIGRDCTSISMK